MNIKITKELAGALYVFTEDEIRFGSEGGDDTDLLCILPPNIQMDSSLHNRDHYLFYKDEVDKVDYLFATPRSLFNGLVTGSSTLLHELFTDGLLKDTQFNWLTQYSNKDLFSFRLAKAYLGVAKRDIEQSFNPVDNSVSAKKLFWADEGIRQVKDGLRCLGVKYDISELGSLQRIESLRKTIKDLPKTPDNDVILDYILNNSGKLLDIPEISSVEYVYYQNWRESL